jgi:hypothetical protein
MSTAIRSIWRASTQQTQGIKMFINQTTKTMLHLLIWGSMKMNMAKLDRMSKVVITSIKCLKIVLVQIQRKELARSVLITPWITYSRKLLLKTKPRKTIWIGIGADNHLIIIVDSVGPIHRVNLRIDSKRKLMISLDSMASQIIRIRQARSQALVEVVLCTEIGLLGQNNEVVI